MKNEDLARVFGEIADFLELKEGTSYRVLAYRNAERELRADHEIRLDLPDTAVVGEPVPEARVTATATVPELATQGLRLVGAETVEGTATAQTVIDNFSKPAKSPHIAISVDMLDTGIDATHPATSEWPILGNGTPSHRGSTRVRSRLP